MQRDRDRDGRSASREHSRRSVLRAGAAGAALAGAATVAPKTARASSSGSSWDPIRFLVNRTTQGFTLADYQHATSLGYQGWLEEQLNFELIDDSAFEGLLNQRFPSLELSPEQLFRRYILPNTQFVAMGELRNSMMLRSVLSPRQLRERMAEFWTDHFTIDHEKVGVLKHTDDRDVVRKHALGSFHDLLDGSAHSAAMMLSLDNHYNDAGAIQENYGRELLELHTLGVNGPYNERDVVRAARILTGWKAQNSYFWYGSFGYWDGSHDKNQKRFMGHYFAPGGEKWEGDRLLRILRRHPSTAQYIASKIVRWLVSHEPPQHLVDNVADTYRQTNGDVREMIRTALDQTEIEALPPDSLRKLRRPYHFITSLLRAAQVDLGVNPQGQWGDTIVFWMSVLGQLPYGRKTPDGYPDTLEAWGTSVLPRWQFASALFNNEIPFAHVELGVLENEIGMWQRDIVANQVDYILTGNAMSADDVGDVQRYVDRSANFDGTIIREAFALAAASPSFQYY